MSYYLQHEFSKDNGPSQSKQSPFNKKYSLNPAFAQLTNHQSKIQWKRPERNIQQRYNKQKGFFKILELNIDIKQNQTSQNQIHLFSHDDKHLFCSKTQLLNITKPKSRQISRTKNISIRNVNRQVSFDQLKTQNPGEDTDFKKKCNSQRSIGIKNQPIHISKKKSNSFNVKNLQKHSNQLKQKSQKLKSKSKIVLSPQKIKNYQFNAINISKSFTNQKNIAKLLKYESKQKVNSNKSFGSIKINQNIFCQEIKQQTNLFWRSSAKKLLRNLSQRKRKQSGQITIDGWNKQEQNSFRIMSPHKGRRYFQQLNLLQGEQLYKYNGNKATKQMNL